MQAGNNRSGPTLNRRNFNLMVSGGMLAAILSGAGPLRAQQQGGTLTVAVATPPISLDPARNGGGVNEIFVSPAYEGLVHIDVDGNITPRLAEDLRYTASDNTEFEIDLRTGLTYADGTPFDASALKDYLEYYVRAGGPFAATASVIDTIEVRASHSLRLNLNRPAPNLVWQFSEGGMWGCVPNPRTIAERPEDLGSTTDGVGPYRLVPELTLLGSEYVYDRNPDYFEPESRHWDRIIVKVIDNPNARLQALLSGQADIVAVDPETGTAANNSGLETVVNINGWIGLFLVDRDGKLVPELGDVRVRRAINMALNRSLIAQALAPNFSEPTSLVTLPGHAGYNAQLEELYPFDIERAKALMAEAGAGEGFSLTVLVPSFDALMSRIGQVVSSQLAEIGITVNIETATTFPAYAERVESGNFPVIVAAWGVGDVYSMLQQIVAPTGVINPLRAVHPEMHELYETIARTPPAEAGPLYDEIIEIIADQAWFAPLMRSGEILAHGRHVENVNNSLTYPNATLVEPAAG